MVVLGRGAVSNERGTTIGIRDLGLELGTPRVWQHGIDPLWVTLGFKKWEGPVSGQARDKPASGARPRLPSYIECGFGCLALNLHLIAKASGHASQHLRSSSVSV